MPYRIDIYIGSDNGSRKIYEDYLNKVKKWANDHFPDGYTLVRGEGYYRGVSEDSVLINALSDHDVAVRDQLGQLKQQLGQEAILVVKSLVEFEII